MELATDRILILAGVWLFYFVVHSEMASLAAKQWVVAHWPSAMPLYRLCFNFVAVVMLIPPLLLIYYWHGPFSLAMDRVRLVAGQRFVAARGNRFFLVAEIL